MAEREFAENAAFFFAGAAVGAAVALLLAPQTGERTRRMIRRQAEEARDYVTDKGGEIRDRGKELAGDARRFVERGVREVTS